MGCCSSENESVIMPRFFVEANNIKENIILIQGEDAKHISTVLRMKKNEKLVVCNGQNIDYDCIIKHMCKETVEVEIVEKKFNVAESKIKIKLFQALPKSDKMEFIIQKCVEIGVDEIVPIMTDNTIIKIEDSKKGEKKLERWNKISESAAKQSMRGKIPKISEILSYIQALEISKQLDKTIIPYENEKINTLRSSIKTFNGKSIGVFIGPEGGFTDKEIFLSQKYDIQSVTLGNRILRTETAGLVTIANIIYELGDD